MRQGRSEVSASALFRRTPDTRFASYLLGVVLMGCHNAGSALALCYMPDPTLAFSDVWEESTSLPGERFPQDTPVLRRAENPQMIVEIGSGGAIMLADVPTLMRELGFDQETPGNGYSDFDSSVPVKSLDTITVVYYMSLDRAFLNKIRDSYEGWRTRADVFDAEFNDP